MDTNHFKKNLFERSSEIVSGLSSLKIEEKTINDYLSFDGVSLWEAVCPSLAAYIFPCALNKIENHDKNIINPRGLKNLVPFKAKPYLKHVVNNIKKLKFRLFNDIKIEYSHDNVIYKNKIFYLGLEPRQIDCLTPLLGLLRDTDVRIICTRTRFMKRYYIKNKLKYIFIEDVFKERLVSEYKIKSMMLKEKINNIKWVDIFNNPENGPGNIWQYIKNDFYELFVYTLPLLLEKILIANYLIDVEKPNLIIGADDCDPNARVFFIAARSRNIPTLHIQYGLTSKESNNWLFSSTEKAAVFSEHTVNVLKCMGIDENKLVITGQPRFDNLVTLDDSRDKIHKQFKIPDSNKIVVFASQVLIQKLTGVEDYFDFQEYKRLLECIYSLTEKFTNIFVLVKPHPDEDIKLHLFYSRKYNSKNIKIVNKNYNLQTLIKGCDIFLARSSTASLEALVALKPVVILNLKRKNIFPNFINAGLFLEANTETEVVEIIKKILSDQEVRVKLADTRNRILDKYIYNSDGKSSERIADLVDQMSLKYTRSNLQGYK